MKGVGAMDVRPRRSGVRDLLPSRPIRLVFAQLSHRTGSTNAGTNLWRLRTLTITIPKHALSISNGHPSFNLIVKTDGTATSYTVSPGQVQVANPIFEGRTVRVYQGSSTTPLRSFTMRKKSSVIVE
ncbi:MAG: hypothetical protein WCQ44_03985 [Opitutaceae bacterium]